MARMGRMGWMGLEDRNRKNGTDRMDGLRIIKCTVLNRAHCHSSMKGHLKLQTQSFTGSKSIKKSKKKGIGRMGRMGWMHWEERNR